MNPNEGSTVVYNPETKGYFEQVKPPTELQTAQQMIPIIKPILAKAPQTRTSAQIKLLNKFSKRSLFFNAIVQHSSVEVAKNLLKYAQLHEIAKNRTVMTKGSELENIIIFLKGRFGITDLTQQKEEPERSDDQIYRKIIENSLKIARDLKRKMKQQDISQASEFKTSKAAMYDIVVHKLIEDQQIVFNLPALVEGKKYSETVITCKNATILTINAKIFYETLASYVRKLKSDKISAFRRFQYFNCIESERLIQLVDQLPLITVKKGHFIYKEGEEVKSIYLLLKGCIKITKSVDLFKQNPNLFYMDRQKLHKPRLPFVDFSEIYNYKPRTKVLQIGITNEMSIFGQEQLYSQKKIRQANAQVSNENAIFYNIQLEKIESSLIDLKNFMAELKEGLFKNQTEKKFIYRQEKLSQLLMCEAKNSMDYFFIEDDIQGREQVKIQNSPRKYKINKVNQMISPTKCSPKQRSIKQAQYHTFNFNKFPLRITQSPQKQAKNKSHAEFTSAQSKVIELVHTLSSRPSTSGQQSFSSPRKNSCTPRRHNSQSKNIAIDINNPLFEMGYFQRNQKEALRIQKQSRLRPLTTQKTPSKLSTSKRMSLNNHLF